MELENSSAVENYSSHNNPVNGGEKGREGGGDSNNNSDDKILNFGGNRWPRQETLALLKIRSDMDPVFRDSCLKGPLWEQVSRKLAELGYHRNAKKCKEKFENVYKYHKRTKESRSNKSEGKTYKFFDQIEALHHNNQFTVSHGPKLQPTLETTTTKEVTLPTPRPSDSNTATSYVTTFPSTNPMNTSSQGNNNNNVPHSSMPNNMNLFSTTTTTISTSSSTASDEDLEERYRKKRKWKDYFRRLAKTVLAKQEEMQNNFLEAIDKRERERVAKYEAWLAQEIARINRENDILVQEQSEAAAKDATLIAFLQNATKNCNFLEISQFSQSFLQPQPQARPQSHMELLKQLSQPQPQSQSQSRPQLQLLDKNSNGDSVRTTTTTTTPMMMNSCSRWPKAEVHALIRLRTNLEAKYEEKGGSKSPMWEEISSEMQKLGYNRSAKRCKQKWENINKYFKKVKESKKQRREDSKTCPYYHELDALYKVKSKNLQNMMKPLMVQPEQQWRPTPQCDEKQHHHQQQQPMEEGKKQSNESDEYEENEEECVEDDDVDEEKEEEEVGETIEDDEGARRHYEIATNKVCTGDTSVE